MTTSHQKKLKATNQKEAWNSVTTWDNERDICGACSEGKDERRRARYDSCDENGYDSDEYTAEEHEALLGRVLRTLGRLSLNASAVCQDGSLTWTYPNAGLHCRSDPTPSFWQ